MKIFFILIFSSITIAQQVNVYLPNGTMKKFPPNTTFGEIEKTFEPMQRITSYYCECGEITQVCYKFFTKEPLFIITKKPECIKKCLKSFNFKKFMRSLLVEIDIKRYMEEKTLTDLYILETLGHPDDLKKDVTGANEYELWFYNDYNLVLKILNGYVIGFMRL